MQPSLIKASGKNMLLDLKSNQLTFLDNRFYITQDGSFVPSVTTYLEAYPKTAQFYEWLKKMGEDADEVRDEAGRRGSVVHKLTEDYDNGLECCVLDENGWIGYKLSEWAQFERYVEFRTRFDMEIIHNEINLTSSKLKMGGTIDRVIKLDGKTILLDIKTSNAVQPSYWLQLAAYEQLITEMYGYNPIDAVGILHLNAKTRTEGKAGQIQGKGWQLHLKEDSTKDWELFQAVQKLWTAENGDQKPRQLSYSITHKK